MKNLRFALYAVMAFATLTTVSCKEDPIPEPEPAVVTDIFFSADNGDYCFYASETDAKTATLKIVRSTYEIADKYTIKVNDATSGLEIPEAVEFAAGENEASITLTAPSSSKAGEKYDFDLSLTGENVNDSASSEEGTIRCEGTIYVYEEVTAVGSFGGTAFNYLGYFPQTVWRMADNKMIFKNFLNSGNDLSFTYAKDHYYAEDGTDYGQSIDVIDYTAKEYVYLLDSDYDAGSTYLYFYDGEKNEYEWFYPKGEQRFIYGLGFYLGNNYSAYVKSGDYDYVYFYAFELDIYGESEGINKEMAWQSLYFDFADKNERDFTGFPELPKPEATRELKVTFQGPEGSAHANDTYDTQIANVITTDTGVDYVIENFMLSGSPLTIHTTNNSYGVTFECGDSYYYENDFYFCQYDYTSQQYAFLWLFPYAADTSKAMNMYFTKTNNPNGAWTCFWYEDANYAQFEANIWFYGETAWTTGNLYFNW